MYNDIRRNDKVRSPMLVAGLIALILFITAIMLVRMNPVASDQGQSYEAASLTSNNGTMHDRP
jgi:hypothetical protein